MAADWRDSLRLLPDAALPTPLVEDADACAPESQLETFLAGKDVSRLVVAGANRPRFPWGVKFTELWS
jgi:hypothetical protein